MELVFFFAVTD